jgi:hypothetical protein
MGFHGRRGGRRQCRRTPATSWASGRERERAPGKKRAQVGEGELYGATRIFIEKGRGERDTEEGRET